MQEPAFPLQPPVELSIGQGRQQAGHGHRYAGFLYEVYLPVENILGVGVESQYEPSANLDPGRLDLDHTVQNSGLEVLGFLCKSQGFLVRGFDSYEHHLESGLDHEIQELIVLSQVDAGFRGERKGIPEFVLPFDDAPKQPLDSCFVADKIVIHDKDRAVVAGPVDRLHLGQELLRQFRANPPAEHFDDVAELAVEGAPAGILQGHRVIDSGVDQVEPRYRRVRDIGLALVAIDLLRATRFEISQEGGKRHLGLIEHEVVHPIDLVERGRWIRAARNDPFPAAPAQVGYVFEGALLHDHARQEHHIGPAQVVLREGRHVHVDQARLEMFRKQRCHRHQA